MNKVRLKGKPFMYHDRVEALVDLDNSPAGFVPAGTKGKVYMISPAKWIRNRSFPCVLGVHWEGITPRKGFRFSVRNDFSELDKIKLLE